MKSNLPIDEALYEQGYNQAIKDLDDCDWKSFRREAAKDILCALIEARKPVTFQPILIGDAVMYTNALIEQLKQE